MSLRATGQLKWTDLNAKTRQNGKPIVVRGDDADNDDVDNNDVDNVDLFHSLQEETFKNVK